jgi:hypothetical protein
LKGILNGVPFFLKGFFRKGRHGCFDGSFFYYFKSTDPSYFCMMNSDTGKWIIIVGGFIVLAGVIIYLFHDKLHWIGRLPGDIRIERENFKFYFPLATMIVLSLLVTLIVNIIRRFL